MDSRGVPGGRFLDLLTGSLHGGGKRSDDEQGNVFEVGDLLELKLNCDTSSLTFHRNGRKFGPGFTAEGEARVQPLPVVLAFGLGYPAQAVTLV